ncbi:hypothetical protein M514_03684, partial [Trichuris suis]
MLFRCVYLIPQTEEEVKPANRFDWPNVGSMFAVTFGFPLNSTIFTRTLFVVTLKRMSNAQPSNASVPGGHARHCQRSTHELQVQPADALHDVTHNAMKGSSSNQTNSCLRFWFSRSTKSPAQRRWSFPSHYLFVSHIRFLGNSQSRAS